MYNPHKDQQPVLLNLGRKPKKDKNLPQQQNFNNSSELEKIIEDNRRTMLTEYFELNKNDPDARELCYHEIPKYYTWTDKKWKKRKK